MINAKEPLIKIGAYIVLVIGSLISLSFIVGGAILLIAIPELNPVKKIAIAIACFILGAIILLVTLSVFETMKEILKFEEEIEDFKEEEKLNLRNH